MKTAEQLRQELRSLVSIPNDEIERLVKSEIDAGRVVANYDVPMVDAAEYSAHLKSLESAATMAKSETGMDAPTPQKMELTPDSAGEYDLGKSLELLAAAGGRNADVLAALQKSQGTTTQQLAVGMLAIGKMQSATHSTQSEMAKSFSRFASDMTAKLEALEALIKSTPAAGPTAVLTGAQPVLGNPASQEAPTDMTKSQADNTVADRIKSAAQFAMQTAMVSNTSANVARATELANAVMRLDAGHDPSSVAASVGMA